MKWIKEFLLCIVVLVWSLACATAHGQELLRGTVFVSRNANEAENTSPGHWNHLAIYVGNGVVVESQGGIVEHGQGRGVIRTSLLDFLSRNYSQILALEPVDPVVGARAALFAEALVGLPFRKWSSLPGVDRPRAMQKGINCDSVVRYTYRQASGERLRRLRIPDRALNYTGKLFQQPKVVR